ncbi:transposase family protein, partial [Pseudomonas aeruginosa]
MVCLVVKINSTQTSLENFPNRSEVSELSSQGTSRRTLNVPQGWFSINVQIVCGPQMEIYDIVVQWPGSVHDSRIFSNSRRCLRFEESDLAGSGILV